MHRSIASRKTMVDQARPSQRHGQAKLGKKARRTLVEPGVIRIEDHPAARQLIEIARANHNTGPTLQFHRAIKKAVEEQLKFVGHLVLNGPLITELVDVQVAAMND